MMWVIFNAYPFGFIISHEDEEEHEEYMEENLTFSLHRAVGYGIVAGSIINSALGLYLLNQYQNGQTPPDLLRIPHRALGYTIFTLSIVQTSLGTYNSIKLWNEPGRLKRLIHGVLSYAATGLYVYAGYLAFKGVSEGDLKSLEKHRNFMLGASGLATLSALWIIF